MLLYTHGSGRAENTQSAETQHAPKSYRRSEGVRVNPNRESDIENMSEAREALSEAFDLPIILYNVPGRTASNMTSDTTLRIANDFDNIVAIKEASGDLDQLMRIIHSKPKDFFVISGEDSLTLSMIAAGADGVISVVGQAVPKEFSSMVRASLAGDFDTAKKLHFKCMDLTNMLFEENNPAGIKAALKAINICEENLRLPNVPVNRNLVERITEEMQSF